MFKAALPLVILISLGSCSFATHDVDDVNAPIGGSTDNLSVEAQLNLPFNIQLGTTRTEEDGWYPFEEKGEAIISSIGEESLRYLIRKSHVRGVDFRLSLEDESQLESSYQSVFTLLENTYGKSQPSHHFATWKTADNFGKLLEISLINGKELYAQSWIEVQWRAHEDRRYAD